MKTVEINGVKIEFDERTARTVDTYKVGETIKVLVKSYGETYTIFPGVVAGFCNFTALPSIEIMYVDKDRWEADAFKFAVINANSKDIEIAPMNVLERVLDKQSIVAKIDSAITRKKLEVEELEIKKAYFIERFSTYFEAKDSVKSA